LPGFGDIGHDATTAARERVGFEGGDGAPFFVFIWFLVKERERGRGEVIT
jgi:hypothetical protein